jgi:fibronectin-binding autotransporter adhesin
MSAPYTGLSDGRSSRLSKNSAASRKRRRVAATAIVSAIALVDCTSRVMGATQTSTWVGASSSSWSTATNWNPSNTDPNNGSDSISDFNVIINSVTSPDVSPTLNISATIDSMTLGTGASLNIQGGNNLTLNGPTLSNNGVIVVNSNQSSFSTLSLTGTLSGTGTVSLNEGTTQAVLAGTITQSAGQTISGFGEITANLTNNGMVDANTSNEALSLVTSTMINSATMEATGGGTLAISGIEVAQSGGQVVASNGVVELVNGGQISGGTVTSTLGGAVDVTNSTSGLTNVTNSGQINIVGGSNLDVSGTLTNNGTITVNSNSSSSSEMSFSGVTLSGTGAIVLNYSGANAIIAGTLTQDAGHTISGYGEITASLTNDGVVNANALNQTLSLTSNMNNNLTLEATGGGTLALGGTNVHVTQGTSGEILASNGVVDLINSDNVAGGTLNTSSGGIIQVTNSSGAGLSGDPTNSGILNIVGGSGLNVSGNLTNNGTITVNSDDSSNSTLTFTGTTLSGSGTIVLNGPTAQAVLAGALNQSSGNTISGFGEITASLTNNGLVNANVSSETLFVSGTSATNTSTMEATSGVLVFNNGVAVTNTGGNINATGNSVIIGSATITGGTLNSTSPQVIFAEAATFGALTISANSTVDVPAGLNLTLNGSTLTNNGTINLNYNDSSFCTLQVNSNTLLTGTGSLTLDAPTTQAVIATGTSDTLTQDIHHTISGFGEITAEFVNNGTVDANISSETLTLLTSNMTNNATMEATSSGTLSIDGITLTQGSGGHVIANNATVDLFGGATISGGTLSTLSSGVIQAINSSTDALAGDPTNSGTFDITGGSNLGVSGNLTNNGTITVNSNDSSSSTLTFTGTSLSGTGTIVLNGVTTQAVIAGTLTQSATNTISGFGEITAALTNNGTVDTNVSGETLTLLTSNMTNNATLEATNGATLTIDGITLSQGSGGQVIANNSTVDLISATLSGGSLTTPSGGVIQATSSSTDTLTGDLTNSGTFDITGGSDLNVSGNLTNNGTIAVNSNDSSFSTLTFTGTSLSGTGTIVLNGATSQAVVAGTLSQSSTNTISGFGEITAALTNNGTVDTNVSGQTLTLLTSNMTNNGTMEATSGSTLSIVGITLTQGSGGQVVANDSTVDLISGATISGGTLTTSSGGVIQATNSSSDVLIGVTNSGTFNIVGASNVTVSGGLVNNGTIAVDSNASSASTLTANSAITGTGSLVINSGGVLRFATNTGGSSQGSVTISGNGQMDVNNNHFFINYGSGSDPVVTIYGYLKSGYNSGNWNGPGIMSTAAATEDATVGALKYGIGWADGKDKIATGISSGTIELKYTLLGDANLDGTVNGSDFSLLAANFGLGMTNWDQGNFLFTSSVNGSDFSALAANFGQGDSGADASITPADIAALDAFAVANGLPIPLITPVPEPACMAMTFLAAATLASRRRRRSSLS